MKNTIYGRKIIRPNENNMVLKRFVLYTVAVLVIGGFIGGIVGSVITSTKEKKQTVSEKNEYILQDVIKVS